MLGAFRLLTGGGGIYPSPIGGVGGWGCRHSTGGVFTHHPPLEGILLTTPGARQLSNTNSIINSLTSRPLSCQI